MIAASNVRNRGRFYSAGDAVQLRRHLERPAAQARAEGTGIAEAVLPFDIWLSAVGAVNGNGIDGRLACDVQHGLIHTLRWREIFSGARALPWIAPAWRPGWRRVRDPRGGRIGLPEIGTRRRWRLPARRLVKRPDGIDQRV